MASRSAGAIGQLACASEIFFERLSVPGEPLFGP
jgi:hypothetical protein